MTLIYRFDYSPCIGLFKYNFDKTAKKIPVPLIMSYLDFKLIKTNSDKQIEDAIDSGHYNLFANILQNQKPLSAPINLKNQQSLHSLDDDLSIVKDRDLFTCDPLDRIEPTDSEVTVVRVKQKSLQFKNTENKWNLNDKSIPGDGTHLPESPSLVNLVTFVDERSVPSDECQEYFIPLSSWELSNRHDFDDQSRSKFHFFNLPNPGFCRFNLSSKSKATKKSYSRKSALCNQKSKTKDVNKKLKK
ncbi:hypothetical protein FQR65_LT02594 [Abscondita terminalis]|nr:hypothetical protein FQR65_LT02594 [Abscondita terminalis]